MIVAVDTEEISDSRRRAVHTAAHTRNGTPGSCANIESARNHDVVEHVALTDLFDFITPNATYINTDASQRATDILLYTLIGPRGSRIASPRLDSVGDSTLILRPKCVLDDREQLFYRRYFDSEAFQKRLLGPDGFAWLRPWNLSDFYIPKPDRATLHALSELTTAARQFDKWHNDAEAAVRSYFKWKDVSVARSHMINAGRLTRQRREAGILIDSRESRLRTTLPFPVATRWRSVKAAQHDQGGYGAVLECAEAALAYCAVLGVVLARADGLPVGPLRAQANRFNNGGSGPTFGTWGTLVRYFATENPFKQVPADSPLTNFAVLAQPDVQNAINANKRRRDQYAHRKGPAPTRPAPPSRKRKPTC